MAKTSPRKTMKEAGERRGLVPSANLGRLDAPYNAYLNELNPRERPEVQFALSASEDPRFRTFLARLERPVGKNRLSLAAIAKTCGIGLEEFNHWWAKASVQSSIAKAQMKSVEITSDMALDARSTLGNCERCDGLRFVPADEGLPMDTPGYRILRFVTTLIKDLEGNPFEREVPIYIRTCPNCDGMGKIRKPGDEFSREKLLETAGLINKKGSGFQIIQNFGGAGMGSAVAQLSALTLDVEPASSD